MMADGCYTTVSQQIIFLTQKGFILYPLSEQKVGWGRLANYLKLLKNNRKNTLNLGRILVFSGQKEQYSPITLNLRGQKEDPD
jgi:hypothetical protein